MLLGDQVKNDFTVIEEAILPYMLRLCAEAVNLEGVHSIPAPWLELMDKAYAASFKGVMPQRQPRLVNNLDTTAKDVLKVAGTDTYTETLLATACLMVYIAKDGLYNDPTKQALGAAVKMLEEQLDFGDFGDLGLAKQGYGRMRNRLNELGYFNGFSLQ